MNDELFDWDSANVEHIAEHDVAPQEAEEVILGEPLDVEFDIVDGEERWSYVGETTDARFLWVTITLRGMRMRVITAFEPEKYWKVFYFEEREGRR